ncbi:MAG TPA: DNA glycosylase [Chthoniobacterales bacterium]|jgi:N-glycosylase/DNA lyase|nr:DNA glycosylase [Chthoniobacterales bacterium]
MELAAQDFDLEKTLNCGQVFHWEKSGEGFVGAIADKAVYVEQRGDQLHFAGVTPKVIARYFSLDHPLAEICQAFPRDPAMMAARDFCDGLRIIRQPRWECLATFICSSMKQVAHIRQISLALRRRFGGEESVRGTPVYTFPSAAKLARGTERHLRECALGYRAKNLLATARLVATGKADLDAWRTLPDEELRTQLCELPGVGAKVANCVMLFAYERLRAFPVDVWIERVLRQQYFPRSRKVTARQLREFCDTYFGEHGGYAQQYLFHHARKGGKVVRPGDVRYDLPGKAASRGTPK